MFFLSILDKKKFKSKILNKKLQSAQFSNNPWSPKILARPVSEGLSAATNDIPFVFFYIKKIEGQRRVFCLYYWKK